MNPFLALKDLRDGIRVRNCPWITIYHLLTYPSGITGNYLFSGDSVHSRLHFYLIPPAFEQIIYCLSAQPISIQKAQ